MVPPADALASVQATWDELGRTIQPHGPRVWLRTWLIPQKIGRIFVPEILRNVYRGLPHSKLVRATVLRDGNGYKAGDFVCFPQTFFSRMNYMLDGTLVGFVHPKYIHGRIQLDEGDYQQLREVEEGRACAA